MAEGDTWMKVVLPVVVSLLAAALAFLLVQSIQQGKDIGNVRLELSQRCGGIDAKLARIEAGQQAHTAKLNSITETRLRQRGDEE